MPLMSEDERQGRRNEKREKAERQRLIFWCIVAMVGWIICLTQITADRGSFVVLLIGMGMILPGLFRVKERFGV